MHGDIYELATIHHDRMDKSEISYATSLEWKVTDN